MIKHGARLGKVWAQKAHVSKKIVLYVKGVTVKYRELHSTKSFLVSQRQVAQTILYSSERKNPQGKRREKIEQGARLAEALKKAHNTNTKFHCREVTITLEDYKIFLYISKITISKTILHIGQHPVNVKTTRKGKRKRRREGKKKRKRKKRRKRKEKRTEKEGLKSFPLEAHRPLRICSLAQFHQWA